MAQQESLAEQFENIRPHLRAVAYRMLGSLAEAEDAVQEAWIRLSRSDADSVDNLGGWLTTVVARVSLDMLRSRHARREDAIEVEKIERTPARGRGTDPEQEMLVANAVGLALLVILDTLTPAERIAFVLHDLFGMPFDEIATIVDRAPDAARQLASRARRRVQGSTRPDPDLARQREVVDAFLAAARGGNFDALLELLDPEIVMRADRAAISTGLPAEIRDARLIAERAIKSGARAAQPVLVNGAAGVVIAPGGRLMMVLTFAVAGGKIAAMEAIADPERLRLLDLAVLEGR